MGAKPNLRNENIESRLAIVGKSTVSPNYLDEWLQPGLETLLAPPSQFSPGLILPNFSIDSLSLSRLIIILNYDACAFRQCYFSLSKDSLLLQIVMPVHLDNINATIMTWQSL